MNPIRLFFVVCCVFVYSLFFLVHEKDASKRNNQLGFALPASFYEVVGGMLKEFSSELLFVKTSVFLGGVPPGTPSGSYENALANNFNVMTSLYPRFRDPYYYCQGFLPHISIESATHASHIFKRGLDAYPEDVVLHFYYASNFFMFMDQPIKAADAFNVASQIPNAPRMFAHLSALLLADAGDVMAGLISLNVLLETETDETIRARYIEEISVFKQAVQVNKALSAYKEKYGVVPQNLQQISPEFISELPDIKGDLVMIYEPPHLRLKRPEK